MVPRERLLSLEGGRTLVQFFEDEKQRLVARMKIIEQLQKSRPEIVHLKSDHVYIEILMNSGEKYMVRGSLNDYMSRLSESFYRIHRSYIINLQYLVQMNQNTVIVAEAEIPMGKSQKEELMARLNKG